MKKSDIVSGAIDLPQVSAKILSKFSGKSVQAVRMLNKSRFTHHINFQWQLQGDFFEDLRNFINWVLNKLAIILKHE